MKPLTAAEKATRKYLEWKRLERKAEQRSKQLDKLVMDLTDDEVAEFVKGCDAVDRELEREERLRLPLKENRASRHG